MSIGGRISDEGGGGGGGKSSDLLSVWIGGGSDDFGGCEDVFTGLGVAPGGIDCLSCTVDFVMALCFTGGTDSSVFVSFVELPQMSK